MAFIFILCIEKNKNKLEIEISNNLTKNMQTLGLTDLNVLEAQNILKKIFIKKYLL
jgi:hypothetical protein